MYDLFDTLMNLFVFAFIGLLVWLYFKEPHSDPGNKDQGSQHEP
jgi:hypothetical protein